MLYVITEDIEESCQTRFRGHMTLFFDDLSFCQNVRFRPLCLPYSSVVPALMDFIRFSRCRVFTVLPGWGRLLLSFCRVRGSGVRRRSSGVSGNGAFLGALWLFKMCPVFLSDKSGLRF